MALTRELGKRFLSLVLVLFLVTLFTALLLSMVPGDPVDTLVPLADSPEADAIKEQVRARPRPRRAAARSATPTGSSDFVTGDENGEHFGEYFRVSGRDPVSTRLAEALPISLQLMVYAQVLALVVAIPLGVLTAYRAGSRFDKARQHRGVRPAGDPELRARARPSPTTSGSGSTGCRRRATCPSARTRSSTSAA